jgi:endonuclease/exonuclease/phosphatase family metal-dependent hydrolase
VWLDAVRVEDGLGLTASAIIDSEADIVSLVEVKNLRGDFVERLKRRLRERGVAYHGSFPGDPRRFGADADTAVISRYPVTEQRIVCRTRENCIVRSMIDLRRGADGGGGGDQCSALAVYSVHLECRCCSCYLPRGYRSNSDRFPGWGKIGEPTWVRRMLGATKDDGRPHPVTDAEVIRRDNVASSRPEAMARLVASARPLEEEDVPIIVMGDFNEPSCLDWTESTAHLADHNGLVYKWDTTELLKQSGFIDSFRAIYPDPVTHPGFTWPAAAQGTDQAAPKATDWIKLADERDRIDYVFFKGHQLEAVDAWLVGTPTTVVKGKFIDESGLFQDRYSYGVGSPWPSDHRAVMTVFELGGTNRLSN